MLNFPLDLNKIAVHTAIWQHWKAASPSREGFSLPGPGSISKCSYWSESASPYDVKNFTPGWRVLLHLLRRLYTTLQNSLLPPLPGVETKIFVFVFSRKFCENLFFAFRKKSLRKATKITKVFAKNDAGSENDLKHPNTKRQTKFISGRDAVDQRDPGNVQNQMRKNCVKLLGN
jgi:hypothetical protein